MIEEAYCSPEVSELLKEKGFDEPCFSSYQWYESGVTLFKGYLPEYSDSCCRHNNKSCDIMSRPTHQMAMAWLREKKKIFIDIVTYTTSNNIQFRWVGYDNGRLFSQEEGKTFYFNSYEAAVEAALLYTLKNLI